MSPVNPEIQFLNANQTQGVERNQGFTPPLTSASPPALMPDSMGLVILIHEDGKTIVHKVDNVQFVGFHFNPATNEVSFLGKVSQDPRMKTRWVCNTAEELEIAETFAKSTPVNTKTTAAQ